MAKTFKNRDAFQPGVFEAKPMDNYGYVPPDMILNHLRDVILVIKDDLSFAWASPSIFGEWGYEDTKLAGKDVNMILNPAAARLFKKAFDEALSVSIPPPQSRCHLRCR